MAVLPPMKCSKKAMNASGSSCCEPFYVWRWQHGSTPSSCIKLYFALLWYLLFTGTAVVTHGPGLSAVVVVVVVVVVDVVVESS